MRPELNPSALVLMCRISLSPLQLLDFWSTINAGAAVGPGGTADGIFAVVVVGSAAISAVCALPATFVSAPLWFLVPTLRPADQLSVRTGGLSSAPFGFSSSLPFILNFFSVDNVTSVTSDSGIESMIFVSWGLANRMCALFHTTRLVCHVLLENQPQFSTNKGRDCVPRIEHN